MEVTGPWVGAEGSYAAIVPQPLLVEPAATGAEFLFTGSTTISVEDGGLLPAADLLAEKLRPATGYRLPVHLSDATGAAEVRFLRVADPSLGEEGYRLAVAHEGITIEATDVRGAIWAVQTLRQLLPPRVERRDRQHGPWPVPAGLIVDSPRFAWRGAMLDVARHFFTVAEVERFIDLMSLYRLNRLHLHLTDDQGWRLMIRSWPYLARLGGLYEVEGTPGGYYSQSDYRRLVTYAASRGIEIVPEIEMPGHVHAAIHAYPALGCESSRPGPYTGNAVGFSGLCLEDPITRQFVTDVLRELAAMTPGEFIHIGGDETYVVPTEAYREFIPWVESVLARQGKRMIGWEEIASAEIQDAVVQHWQHPGALQTAVARGAEIIMSPARFAYFDSKYDAQTTIGAAWTGEFLDVRKAYDWEPETYAPPGARLLGVEGPIWTETAREFPDVEYLAFPRLIGLAEIGWSRQPRDWVDYRQRLAAQAPRLDALEVNYYRSPDVDWD